MNGVAQLLTQNSNLLTNYNVWQEKNHEILNFMQLLMDECTHLLNFDKPIDPSLVYIIAAINDAYILRDGVHDFNTIWPGIYFIYYFLFMSFINSVFII
jgi:hypothetical protein